MEPNQTITIDLQVWNKTQAEIERLKQENLVLKVQIRQIMSNNSQNRSRHSLTQQNLIAIPDESKNFQDKKTELKKTMSEWMDKLNSKLKNKEQQTQQKFKDFIPKHLKRNLSQIQEEEKQQKHSKDGQDGQEQFLQNIQIQSNSNQMSQQKQILEQILKKEQLFALTKKKSEVELNLEKAKQMKLIQAICLFGPGQQDIKSNILTRKMSLRNSLLYIDDKQESKRFQIYGQYFYPDGLITVRNIREEEASTQVHQIIFRKNAKKEDCNLFLFRGDETNQQLKLQNPIMSKINPGKWLSTFFVQFSDFDIIQVEQNNENEEDKVNKSTMQRNKSENQIKDNHIQQTKSGQQSDRVCSKKKINTHHVKGKYTLCIFTYFPIISIMQQFLSSILDQIKIRRVQKFGTTNKISDVTIQFFINQLSQLGSQIYSQIQKIPCTYTQKVTVAFGNFQIIFDMSQAKIDDLLFSGWVHDVLKIFQKDLIYQLFTNMMTEESICFVSENMHLLTYVVFLFVCVLTNPFSYPHPCISNVFNFQLLQSPFVVTAGISQTSKWLQQNVTNYPKKIFVDLNDQCKIKGKKKPKVLKSQKLKKIFSTLYRKIQSSNSPVPQIFKKKQTIIRPATRQQNDASTTFLKSLQYFYAEQIFNFLPNRDIITYIRDKIEEKNQIAKIYNILKEIQKYLKQSRKHKEKDQFVDMLIQQQIFYVFMGAKYELD